MPSLLLERAPDGGNPFGSKVEIPDCGLNVGMPQQALKHENISALLKLVGSEAMAQGMDAPAPGQAGFFFAAS